MKLIFVHGSADNADSFYHQTKYFPDSDAVTLPGHPTGVPCGSAELYAEWLRGYLSAKSYTDVVLAGHSLGGAIVLTYALKYPDEVKGVVPLGSGPYFHIDPARQDDLRRATLGDKRAWDQWLSEQGPRDGLPADVAKRELEGRIAMGPSIIHHDLDCCARYNIAARLQDIRVPVLAVAATGDPYCPPADSYKLSENIPNAKTVVVDGPTHWLMIDRHEAVNKAIEGWLKTI
ncbi:MAG: alpha/beta hydrolase [Chloroflexi bacterium]|nr:alpha/beta hydrolase [Chloroflexota bacterium]